MSKLGIILVGVAAAVFLLVLIRLLWERWWRRHWGKPKS
jgi:hypothetical protein